VGGTVARQEIGCGNREAFYDLTRDWTGERINLDPFRRQWYRRATWASPQSASCSIEDGHPGEGGESPARQPWGADPHISARSKNSGEIRCGGEYLRTAAWVQTVDQQAPAIGLESGQGSGKR
jgi:hypothetical protein